mmetsp:Transcript_14311/g.38829  ORF Transcript_14311/g.38829 Transcript_14311/m.38829 type:complete len:147 (-) Transcript_14311:4-444(-)|eukprot:scaffold118665_cov30-Tisochrysis_lutea.AAC.2
MSGGRKCDSSATSADAEPFASSYAVMQPQHLPAVRSAFHLDEFTQRSASLIICRRGKRLGHRNDEVLTARTRTADRLYCSNPPAHDSTTADMARCAATAIVAAASADAANDTNACWPPLFPPPRETATMIHAIAQLTAATRHATAS